MEILIISKDEIINILFKKKYKKILPELKIEFSNLDNNIDQLNNLIKKYKLIIADLDHETDKIIEIYQQHKENKEFLFITDREYENFIDYLMEDKINNIYPKGLILEDYKTSALLITNIYKNKIFGIKNYIKNPVYFETIPIHYSAEIKKLSLKIEFLFSNIPKEKILQIKLAFYEIVSNVFYHSNELQKGKESYISEPIYITFAEDLEKIIFCVEDRKGKLTKSTVLYWLEKRLKNDKILPDGHGRGFLLMKNIVDSLIINIISGKKTEFIAIFYKYNYLGEKSLLIHQK
ncbi:MAG TPA: ATP-binding protein [Spirochaetota bacterium]|nr:ATP-binding protein [Spirochaetota bacterium]HOM38951.1 ATP-binding protein [Spirochaetota bacterium]HPQ49209.1 ATP-binding protein [Spirochaetota bacterium]